MLLNPIHSLPYTTERKNVLPHHSMTLPPRWLVIALIALPQVGETLFVPALPNIAQHWQRDSAQLQWVLSFFFLGFAPGIWFWGRLCDTWGRRPVMLTALGIASASTLGCLFVPNYELMLVCRFLQGFGLATCSVTTQTVLRDRLSDTKLVDYFVTIGMVLAWSPALGPIIGQWLVDGYGYLAVIAALLLILISLLSACLALWPETRPTVYACVDTRWLIHRMLSDRALQRTILLVAGFNILIFSFYAVGPFMIGTLPGLGFGWIGLAVALTGSLGAAWNRLLPTTLRPSQRISYALYCVTIGLSGQLFTILFVVEPSLLWAVPAFLIFTGYGLAIPNLLGPALHHYRDCLGQAGALFGLAYYLIIGLALGATSLLSFRSPLPLWLFWSSTVLLMLITHRKRPTHTDPHNILQKNKA